jgi:hypothetical protein
MGVVDSCEAEFGGEPADHQDRDRSVMRSPPHEGDGNIHGLVPHIRHRMLALTLLDNPRAHAAEALVYELVSERARLLVA